MRPLAYTRLELSNGLVALLNEDHASPIVSIDLLVHVGAKDESTGHTGLAHLCEHLMGQGSPNLAQEEKAFVLSLGGSSPAWAQTDEDRTQYFYTLPSNQLETALWMEGDRFATPLSKADDAHVKLVREVIRQERLQNRENQAFGDANRLTLDQFYVGRDRHPRDPLGPMADLDAVSASDAKQFCAPYYVPNNIIIGISGDFKTADAERWIRTYFGSIPRGAVPAHPDVMPVRFASEKRLVLEDARTKAPTLRISWFGAGVSNPDREPLNALAALLAPDPRLRSLTPGGDRAGRLSKLLVYDRQLATSVTAANIDMQTAGIFEIEVAPRDGASLSAIEALVDSVVADLKTTPFTAQELVPFKHMTPTVAATFLQTRAARADTLAQSLAFANDPEVYVKQARHVARLTPAEVQDVARRYLTSQRVVLSLIPAGRAELASKPELPFTNVTPKPSKAQP
jgi:zinc protease